MAKKLVSATLSFDNATSIISDSNNQMGLFENNEIITISGSANNDGTYRIISRISTAQIQVNFSLTNEAAGATITVLVTNQYQAATISFTAATKVLADSGNKLDLFSVGDFVEVSGSTGGQNDRYHRVVSVAAGQLVFTNTVEDEAAGETITIERLSGYREIEAAVVLIIANLPELSEDKVTAGDTRPIDIDNQPTVICFPGDFGTLEKGSARVIKSWTVSADLLIMYNQEEMKMWREFRKVRDAIIEELERHPSLNALVADHSEFSGLAAAGVTKVHVNAAGPPEEIFDRQAGTEEFIGPLGIYQTLNVNVSAYTTTRGGELL